LSAAAISYLEKPWFSGVHIPYLGNGGIMPPSIIDRELCVRAEFAIRILRGGDMLLKKMIWLGLLCISVLALFGCNNNGTSKKISLEKREILQKRTERLRKAPLRFAVGGMITPKDGFVYYREFINYIGEKLNRPVEFIDREKYD
jgi:hypothetical protein